MKKILLLALLVTVFGCWGPDLGEGKFYKYTLINESGVLVVIKGYDTQYLSKSSIITSLGVKESLTKTYQDGLPPSNRYNFTDFLGDKNNSVDSIVVIYNNEKFESFVVERENKFDSISDLRNPLNLTYYDDTSEVFTFTKEDYENAEPCNGNCL